MAILCPNCQCSITVKSAKPGRYSPKCPKCSNRFALLVPEDPDEQWIVEVIDTELPPTKKMRALGTFLEANTDGETQPKTEKNTAADTEKMSALTDAVDDQDDTEVVEYSADDDGTKVE